MQCPLRKPLQSTSPTKMCPDNLCSDNCSSKYRAAPFGLMFDQCSYDAPIIPTIKGQIWEEFKITEIPAIKSESDAIIAFATHLKTNAKVVIKAFPEYASMQNSSANLIYEVGVYESMRQLAAAVPHLVSGVASFKYCRADLQNKAGFSDMITMLSHKEFAELDVRFHFLVTERAIGPSLADFLDQRRPLIVVKSIIFQLLFSIYAMTMAGFQHNDLHYENIIVESDPRCKRGIYKFENQTFIVPMPVKIRIYDFDLSSCGVCGPNPTLSIESFCPKYGICDQRNPKFDMYVIFRYIEDSTAIMQHPEALKIIKTALGPADITELYDYRMCNEVSEGICAPFTAKQPSTVQSPIVVLLSNFAEYRVKYRKRK